ncbi:MAG: TetR family transcriptional regulator [Actinobacteria bacterium]|nr:TetR family transcriptional regulator [Actinomycetota bacterium]
MPRLWSETIDAHRREVRDAILDATVALVEEHGLLSVTMSQIAEASGIGRATLYKYFPDVETIVHEWHERQIGRHLQELAAARDRVVGAPERLFAVLETYALIAQGSRGHHDSELAAVMHRAHRVAHAENEVRRMMKELLKDAVDAGMVRGDVPLDELATYCLHALSASNRLPSKTAVRRLVEVTLRGLRPE